MGSEAFNRADVFLSVRPRKHPNVNTISKVNLFSSLNEQTKSSKCSAAGNLRASVNK